MGAQPQGSGWRSSLVDKRPRRVRRGLPWLGAPPRHRVDPGGDPRSQRRALGERARMKLSVVIPTHDEAGSIAATVRACAAALSDAGIDYELLVIDDAS